MHLVLNILTQQWFGRGHIEDRFPPLVVCLPWIKCAVMSKVLLLLLGNSIFFLGLLPMRLEAGFELVQNNDAELLRILFLVPRQDILCRNSIAFKKRPAWQQIAAHERHAIHPGFLDTGIVASTAGEGGLLLLLVMMRHRIVKDLLLSYLQRLFCMCSLQPAFLYSK